MVPVPCVTTALAGPKAEASYSLSAAILLEINKSNQIFVLDREY